MKFLLIVCIVFSLNYSASAQTQQGNVIFGGSAHLSFNTANVNSKYVNWEYNLLKSKSFEFSPQVGFFIKNGLVLGLNLPISYTVEKYKSEKISRSSLSAVPFLRYYFNLNRVKPFIDGGLGFGSIIEKVDQLNGSESENYIDFISRNIGFGLAVFLNERVSLDFSFSYILTLYSESVNQIQRLSKEG